MSSRDPGSARGRPDGAEPLGVRGRDDADVREAILEGRVEEQLAPAASRAPRATRRARSRAARDLLAVECELAAADADRLPKRKRWPVRQRVQPPCALGERGEAGVPGGEADAGADRSDVVQVAPRPLELEQDRAGARELGRRDEAERLLAGVRVGDAVRDGAGGAGARRRTRGPRRASFPRPPARGRDACRRAARRAGGCGRRRRGSGSGRTRSCPRGSARRRPGRRRRRESARPAVERRVVVDERPQRLVAGEADARGDRAPRARPSRPPARDRRSRARPVLGSRPSRAGSTPSRVRRAACARASRPTVACRPANRQPSASAASTRSR